MRSERCAATPSRRRRVDAVEATTRPGAEFETPRNLSWTPGRAARDVRGQFCEARRRGGGRDEGERRRDERREEPVLRHCV